MDLFNQLTASVTSRIIGSDISAVTIAALSLCEKVRELPWTALLPDEVQTPKMSNPFFAQKSLRQLQDKIVDLSSGIVSGDSEKSRPAALDLMSLPSFEVMIHKKVHSFLQKTFDKISVWIDATVEVIFRCSLFKLPECSGTVLRLISVSLPHLQLAKIC